jgi:hypothetical protein
VIRIAVVAALFLIPGVAEAKRPYAPQAPEAPEAPAPPKTPQAPRHSLRIDVDIPEIPEIHQLIEIPDFSEILEMDFGEMQGLPRLLAHSGRTGHSRTGDDDDEESDDDNDDKDKTTRPDQKGVHVYRMNDWSKFQNAFRWPRVRVRDEDDFDERNATGQARGNGSATLAVKGPVTFQMHAQAGEVEVVGTDKQQVSISVGDAPAEEVRLSAFGDRIEPSFRGRRLLRRGKLHVELPRGSRLDIGTLSGGVSAQRVGEVRIHTLSGDVKLAGVTKAEVQSISGDVRIDDASGPVRLHLVSGRATVQTSGAAPQLEFQSTSGSLDWGGTCGRDCHLSAETVSGEVRLALDPRSSFELSYTSHSGELRDELNLAVKRAPTRKHGMSSGWMEATFGKGEGVIEADAFSGNLLVKRK